MAIVAIFEFPHRHVDDYLKVFEIGGAPVADQPDRLHHVAFRTEHGFTVVDVWRSDEAFAEFGAVIGPVMAQLGLDDVPPRVHPVVRTVSREGVVTDH